MMRLKTFFVVSALQNDSMPAGQLKQHATEQEAIDSATRVCETRACNSQRQMDFYVLKVVAKVGPSHAPITVQKVR